MELKWSGRPGSNRPPRPWQGRALPNELLPHKKSFFEQDGKDSNRPIPAKILEYIIYTWECTMYFQEHLPRACPYTCVGISCSIRLSPMLQNKIPVGKTGIQRSLPNYGRNLFRGSPCLEFDP